MSHSRSYIVITDPTTVSLWNSSKISTFHQTNSDFAQYLLTLIDQKDNLVSDRSQFLFSPGEVQRQNCFWKCKCQIGCRGPGQKSVVSRDTQTNFKVCDASTDMGLTLENSTSTQTDSFTTDSQCLSLDINTLLQILRKPQISLKKWEKTVGKPHEIKAISVSEAFNQDQIVMLPLDDLLLKQDFESLAQDVWSTDYLMDSIDDAYENDHSLEDELEAATKPKVAIFEPPVPSEPCTNAIKSERETPNSKRGSPKCKRETPKSKRETAKRKRKLPISKRNTPKSKSCKKTAHMKAAKRLGSSPENKIECRFCFKRFSDKSSRKRHEARHGKLKIKLTSVKKCESCDKAFNPFKLRFHMQLHKKPNSRRKLSFQKRCSCGYCKKLCASQRLLGAHLALHHRVEVKLWKNRFRSEPKKYHYPKKQSSKVSKIYTCDICKVVCQTLPQLSKHMRQEHRLQEKFACNQCKSSFCSEYILKEHLSSRHKVKKPKKLPAICTHCNASFTNQGLLSRHVVCEHNDTSYFKCSDCEKSTVTYHGLSKHRAVHHPKVLTQHQCEVCGKVLVGRGLYKNHMDGHKEASRPKTKPPVKNAVCDVCGKAFCNRSVMKLHQVSHSKERPFKCDLCSATFKVKKDLTGHKMFKHEGISYPCSVCSKEFRNKSQLKLHTNTHSSPNEKPFKCSKCPKAFRLAASQRYHESTHGKKEIKCEQCGKMFYSQYHLRVHVVSCHSVCDFVCDVCSKTFKMKHQLTNHLISHSVDSQFKCSYCPKTFKFRHNFRNHVKDHHKFE